MLFVRIAGFSGAAAVALGAYGAHGLKGVKPEFVDVWQRANLYHFLHTTVMLFASQNLIGTKRKIVCGLLSAGVVLFSGSCYAVGLYQDRSFGKLAPYGGMCFIGGWLAIAVL